MSSASPSTEKRKRGPVAVGPIPTVARTFRWLALAGLAFTAALLGKTLFNLQRTGDDGAAWVVLTLAFLFGLGFMSLLFIAKNLLNGHPAGRHQAIWACRIMYLGFPMLTVVGVLCKRQLDQHFPSDADPD
jgi:hypothetical protein